MFLNLCNAIAIQYFVNISDSSFITHVVETILTVLLIFRWEVCLYHLPERLLRGPEECSAKWKLVLKL